MTYKQKSECGFSLVEIAFVIVIGGLLISMFVSSLSQFFSSAKQAELLAQERIINEAIQEYLQVNGKLPCPARSTDTIDSANFGREVSLNCQTVLTGSGIDVSAGVVTGMLPVRSLNISDSNAFDPWKSRYTYSVTAIQASSSIPYDDNNGAISISDSAGNSIITPAGSAPYVIVSHGENAIGAYTTTGNLGIACASSASNIERANCDRNERFVNTLITSDTGANAFDDHIIYRTGQNILNIVPSSAVMAFASASCPAGWQRYVPAVGRFILGARESATYPNVIPPGNLPTTFNADPAYIVGDTSGNAWRRDDNAIGTTVYDNMPPYLTLLYCIKI